jgi:hypothetical protein
VLQASDIIEQHCSVALRYKNKKMSKINWDTVPESGALCNLTGLRELFWQTYIILNISIICLNWNIVTLTVFYLKGLNNAEIDGECGEFVNSLSHMGWYNLLLYKILEAVVLVSLILLFPLDLKYLFITLGCSYIC